MEPPVQHWGNVMTTWVFSSAHFSGFYVTPVHFKKYVTT